MKKTIRSASLSIRLVAALLLLTICFGAQAQTASVSGQVTADNEPAPFATVLLEGTPFAAFTDAMGEFTLADIPAGSYTLTVKFLGFVSMSEQIALSENQTLLRDFILQEDALNLEGVVVSGTRYERDRVNNPVVVGVIDDKLFNATQSIAISEGLNFQSGVRVETNCQNCGFTQVRLNGLEGAYSQILINSRPVFSALNSVYGLDQIPTNIVE
ncbi:MAG: TonB-dependent receptor, partial [Bacteroidota bacterium]